MNTETLKTLVLTVLKEQKAVNTHTIALTSKSDLADYIVIATGTSGRHLITLKDKLKEELKANSYKHFYSEGEETGNWIVIDLNDVIIHLFREEVRSYYKIEEIWDNL